MTTGRLRKEKGKEREEKKGNISQEECARSLPRVPAATLEDKEITMV